MQNFLQQVPLRLLNLTLDCLTESFRDVALETTDHNFVVLVPVVLVLKDWSRPFSGPMNHFLACMHHKIIILFAHDSNKEFYLCKLH